MPEPKLPRGVGGSGYLSERTIFDPNQGREVTELTRVPPAEGRPLQAEDKPEKLDLESSREDVTTESVAQLSTTKTTSKKKPGK